MLFTVDPALFGETADPSISAVSMDAVHLPAQTITGMRW